MDEVVLYMHGKQQNGAQIQEILELWQEISPTLYYLGRNNLGILCCVTRMHICNQNIKFQIFTTITITIGTPTES